MVISRQTFDTPVNVVFAPRGNERLPVQVVQRCELLPRIPARELDSLQLVAFHQLIVCTAGSGKHTLDYEQVELTSDTIVRTYPGQVHRFHPDTYFDGPMLIWPDERNPPDLHTPKWFPGSWATTKWQPKPEVFNRVVALIEEIRLEQDRFDGSDQHVSLMQSMLRTLLLRLTVELSAQPDDKNILPPQPYIAFRQLIEKMLHQRPTVIELAQKLSYSTRTLDRSCKAVTGQTAKQVLDKRVALEIRRLLTHTNRSLSQIRSDFGFNDQSNFTKFVNLHLGSSPSEIRMESKEMPLN